MNSPVFRLIAPVIPYQGTADGRPIERALQSLQKLDQIHSGKQHDQRAAERFTYNSKPIVIFPAVSDPSDDYPSVQVACTAWTRNLSSSGISLLVPSALTPISGIDDTIPCVDLNDVSLERSKALIGLHSSNSKTKWLESNIVRTRALCGLGTSALELGMRFEEQHSREWPDADRLEELVGELRGDR